VFSKLERDQECRVVILSAAGKMFSSGIDLSFYLFALLTVSYLVTSHTV
jgi:enoyl-CoA hydratase/carnithine racemase